MRKHIQGLIAAATTVAVITACSSNGSTPSASAPLAVGQQPGSTHVNPMDAGPQDLHAAGATFPAQAYNGQQQPVGVATSPQAKPSLKSDFAKYGGSGTIYYCLTGSGFGRKIFIGDTAANATAACAPLGATPTGAGGRTFPLDFVGSDAALASTDYTDYHNNMFATYGEPYEFPSIGGPIVYGYKNADFNGLPQDNLDHLKLSVWTQCAIANGTITDWNDPAITNDNGGTSVTGGSSLSIQFYYRSDSSGTSYLYQSHLNTVCGTTWAAPYNTAPYESAGHSANWGRGFGTTWLGPTTGNFHGESGNPGVLASIQATTGGTGYVEGAYAKVATAPTVQQALAQNKAGNFIDPTIKADVTAALAGVKRTAIQYGGGSDGINLATSRPECIIFIPPSAFANPTNASAYPIVGISYMMFYGNNQGVHTADKVKLANWMESTGGNGVATSTEYSPINTNLETLVNDATNGTNNAGTGKYTGKPCLQ